MITKKDNKSMLEKEYDSAVMQLKTFLPGSEEYLDQLEVIERLHKLIVEKNSTKKQVSPDTVLNGVVGLLQVGAILGHERLHNITTKAIGFVRKVR